ncbi:MAG: patatin-like phospholipase family protein [Solirubrobacterales bacterium]|nr:patatin-like phospholipase family protein [Solirubrobacterales bacterium]
MSDERRIDLVLEGGGVKGIGLVGALAVLEERGFVPQNIAGTSAGAIAAVLTAAGYTPTELRSILRSLDFGKFKDKAWEDMIPLIGAPLSLFKDRGVYEGEFFLGWIGELLAAKDVFTYADLVHPEFSSEPRFRYRGQVIASDLTDRRLLVLPQDSIRFGVEPDQLNVAEAVRMSMSIPAFFEPWSWKSETDGRTHTIVDGGMLSNFPVWLYDDGDDPSWPTFGLMLVEPEPSRDLGHRLPPDGESGSLPEFAKSIVHTMLEAHDRMYLESASFVRTISVKTLGVRTTEFDLSRERADALYESGRSGAESFLAGWDFEAYKAGFRRSEAPSRRASMKAAD